MCLIPVHFRQAESGMLSVKELVLVVSSTGFFKVARSDVLAEMVGY